ncbi:hypothetical protein V1477_003782 [Vespula maculifrons]|uniref:Uncharacterized protein n=1 Tax=Vespula maculifrons TaxID=7453 RepID=A0ABD2CS14_VESMC
MIDGRSGWRTERVGEGGSGGGCAGSSSATGGGKRWLEKQKERQELYRPEDYLAGDGDINHDKANSCVVGDYNEASRVSEYLLLSLGLKCCSDEIDLSIPSTELGISLQSS